VNFIPYNRGEDADGAKLMATERAIIQSFQAELEKAGVPSTIRHTMGDDIDAACGQLAAQYDG
jgi:23S rRNA (adenine2503-C2)-methyltransferase